MEKKIGEKMIVFDTRIRKIGDSKFILIPTNEIKILEAEEGDIVHVMINRDAIIVQRYECKLCGHKFDSDDLEPYCPVCVDGDINDLKIIDADDNISKETELKGGDEE